MFSKIEAGIEDDLVSGESGGEGACDLLGEEGCHGAHEIGPTLVGVGDLGLADRVHDEERDSVLGAEAGVAVIGEGRHVVKEVDVGAEDLSDDLGSPGVDGEEGGGDLLVVGG